MQRSKKLLIISHCMINQNSVVSPLARAKGAFGFIEYLLREGIGLIQLPCPELRYLGIGRRSMEKYEYDSREYRELCRELFIPVLNEIKNYIENGYEITGIIGINESPTCSITKNRGIFMEEIFEILEKNDIKLKFFEVPAEYDDEKDCEDLYNEIKNKMEL